MSHTTTLLRRQAIVAAKQSDWHQAVDINQQILDINPEDTNALNRLGVALAQQGKTKDAQAAFSTALSLDKTNAIAQRHLDKLKNNKTTKAPSFTAKHFIEEPGKTKTVDLHRLAGKKTLEKLGIGQNCDLKPKNRYISVEVDDDYVGALPEDLSYRLTKLMKTGNVYSCTIRSVGKTICSVFLKEESRSKRNADIHSFPPGKLSQHNAQDLDDRALFEEDVPMEIVETDDDDEKTLDDVDEDSLE